MAISRAQRVWRRKSRRRSMGGWLLVPAFFVVGGLGGAALAGLPGLSLSDWIFSAARQSAAMANVAPTRFPVCSGGGRVTCVVDGDTFWLDGTKIRIADINTPEVSQPSCPAEATLGRQATLRLQDLLNAGPFVLRSEGRDADVYGRKLRIVERDGRSIGDTLVAEGLAHPWRGRQESWC